MFEFEKNNTLYNIKNKFVSSDNTIISDVEINFTGKQADDLKEIIYFLENLDYIIEEIGEQSEIKRPNFSIKINNKTSYYENENIILDNAQRYNNQYSNTKIKIF